jgi:hypothetical protein
VLANRHLFSQRWNDRNRMRIRRAGECAGTALSG